jgi:hypothetical protein
MNNKGKYQWLHQHLQMKDYFSGDSHQPPKRKYFVANANEVTSHQN